MAALNAGCVWDAVLEDVYGVLRFVRWLRTLATHHIAPREADSSAVDLRFVSAEYHVEFKGKRNVLSSFLGCGLHLANISVGEVVKATNEGVCKAMCAYAQVLSMGNFWTRTMIALETCVDRRLLWNHLGMRVERNEAVHTCLWELLLEPSMAREFRTRVRESEEEKSRRSKRKFKAKLAGHREEWYAFFTVDMVTSNFMMSHTCSLDCGCLSRADAVRRALDFSRAVVYSKRPL